MGGFLYVFYGPSYCHCAFSTKVYSLHLARSPRRPRWDAERAFTPVKHNLREFNKCFFMVWKCCLQCFLWHKLKSCTTVGSLPGEPNCHMLDEEWRGQQVSCKVFSTIYRDVSTFGNYQASIIIHSCFYNANHSASHFANLTGTCMRQLSEMEMCGACRKLKDVRMRYQDHENHFDSWTMG